MFIDLLLLLPFFFIFSAILPGVSATAVEHLNQVMAHVPLGASQQELCWLVENSYIDAQKDATGKTFSTCRFGDQDVLAFVLRPQILEESMQELMEEEEPWLNLTDYSGPRPFNNGTDYCTEIIQYVIQPMYDSQGNHISEAYDIGSSSAIPTNYEEAVSSIGTSSVKKRSSDSDIEECIDEPCNDVRDCIILNGKCGQCSNSGGGEQTYCDWHMSYILHYFVVWCWYNLQHTCK